MTTLEKSSRVSISHAQFFHLCDWLRTADLSSLHTKWRVAERATEALGFLVSESAVTNALEATNVVLPDAPATATRRDRSVILARSLMELMNNLGYTPSPELVSVANSQSVRA